jgi:hypothetical protein
MKELKENIGIDGGRWACSRTRKEVGETVDNGGTDISLIVREREVEVVERECEVSGIVLSPVC